MKQTRLEREAINTREDLLVKNDYQRGDNEYSENHKDAKSDGDPLGKGVGTAATPYLLPNEKASKTSYTPTIRTDDGGGGLDVAQRNYLKEINTYSQLNAYGVDSVDTSKNVAEGQYVVTIK